MRKDLNRKPTQVDVAEGSHVKKVIGVISGKGGVGKSLLTSLLATHSARTGAQTAILDADVTGPSIPHSFGLHQITGSKNKLIQPVTSRNFNIKMISTNLLLDKETDPVLWRGPIVAQAVRQFWSEVNWGSIDVMFVDMPPGTGDVALTVFQSLPIDGIVIVTTPQDMVSMIVQKAVNMAQSMQIPVLGIVENMAYFQCPDCQSKHEIFGPSHTAEIAREYQIPLLASLPINPELAKLVDQGEIEAIEISEIHQAIQQIL